MGGVSNSVLNDLMVNNLPYYQKSMNIGEVVFKDNIGSFSNATMIGYAASVDAREYNKSNEEILISIMRQIKLCCQDNFLHKVNIPLLGTGAGGLSAKSSFNIIKSLFEKDTYIDLCIFAYSDSVFNEIITDSYTDIGIKNPRVFISYTGTDAENRKWVKDLACKLRENGVDARIDIFHLKPGQDLPQWMTNELIMADKVLLICDKYYAEKADNRKGGVGWETMIIQGDMLSKQEQNKYITILRSNDIDQSLPIYVKSKYALNWSQDDTYIEEFDDLLYNLFDCDIEPPIGEIPMFIKEKQSV